MDGLHEQQPPAPGGPARTGAWSVGLQYAARDPRAVAAALRVDVGFGMQVAWIRLDPALRSATSVPAGAHPGTALRGVDDAAVLLDAVGTDAALMIDAGAHATAVYDALRDATARSMPGGVLADPLGAFAEAGVLGWSVDDALDDVAMLAARARSEAPFLAVLLASGVPYHDAGATVALELGACLATAITYARAAREEGVDAGSQLVLRLVVDSDVFVSMAKIRAARWLWRAIAPRLGLSTGEVRISARTAWRNRTRKAPRVNLLRSTVEGFAGATGGADDLAVQPLDEPLGPSTDAARRWALGIQHILRSEAHVGAVQDPAAGSGYVETLTRTIAAEAWAVVREIEAAGGMGPALASGLVQSKIPAPAEATLVGVTLFPDPEDAGLPPPEDPPVPLPSLRPPAATTTPLHRPRIEEGQA